MKSKFTLYLRWIVSNALGEVFGLGGTIAVGALAFTYLGNLPGAGKVLVMFLIAVGSGVIEASVVGLLQWWAMHPWFQAIQCRSWWLATLVGSLVAYVLGWMPSTIMNLSQEVEASPSTPASEPPQWVILLLAGGLGVVAGAVLSFAQWLVLHKGAKRAGVWIPANMLAWLFGMPIIFWGIDLAQKGLPLASTLLVMAFVLLLAGVVVGGIHGLFLLKISRSSS